MGDRRKRGERDDYRGSRGSTEGRYGRDEPWREERRERYPDERYGGDRPARRFESGNFEGRREPQRGEREWGSQGADYRQDFGPEGYSEFGGSGGYGHGYKYGFGDSSDYRPERMPFRGSEGQPPEDWSDREGWRARADSGGWNRGRTSGGYGSEHASWQSGVRHGFGFGPGEAPADYGQGDMNTGRPGRGAWDTDWAANRPARGPGRWSGDWSTDRTSGSEYGAEDYRGRSPRDYRRSDDRIREDVCDRFTDDAELDPSEVTVRVESGEVTLTGSVSNRHQKRRAEEIAERISGVREVINQLRVARGETAQQSMQTATSQQQSGTRARAGAVQPGVAADKDR